MARRPSKGKKLKKGILNVAYKVVKKYKCWYLGVLMAAFFE